MTVNYKSTLRAAFSGYIVQAIINNFAPLLFLTFQSSYGIPLAQITLLVTVNFAVQLFVDMLAIAFVDKIGYRISVVAAHFFAAAGLIGLGVLPALLSSPFAGLLISVIIYAMGGGLLEVLVSPIVESCPTDNKEKTMSLLHSFYCWGHVLVVMLSTAFFAAFGIGSWKVLAVIWAMFPIFNGLLFTRVPLVTLNGEGNTGLSVKRLARKKIFWVLMLVMVCAGAGEQAVSQWASAFAQSGLGVDKAIGDLAGPMFFAVMMGISRVFYGKLGHKIDLHKFMMLSSVLCVLSYLLISLTPGAVTGLIACGICGLSVGILWPGTFSTATASIKGAGTSMFALLALAGDLGCSAGPTLVGMVSSAAGGNLKAGMLSAVIFPVLLIVGLLIISAYKKRDAPMLQPE